MKPPVKYCAIYTRKSSEEGLEQEFNSLDAQRESCLAYIMSQKSEGWAPVKGHYDDGGFSGGNMERPALKKLMEDIQAGKVHIVVVYKIDRLTRSLMDFAKLVEVFDRHGVTFVSVTQSFNTTTSMGRLTLNVLLSFAQFEREVTGERIRDKIAASKKKGMWMGGMTPIGYDRINKQLVVNEEGAKTVRLIFEKYLELGCVRRLKEYLDVNGIRSKIRTTEKGRQWGGAKFSRGLLYTLLINPVYVGRIKHKEAVYDGQHPAILPQELWDQVQARMAQNAVILRGSTNSRSVGNLLKGLLCDAEGNKYSPSFTNKGKRQYRYYVSQALLQDKPPPPGIMTRLPAHELEVAVEEALKKEFETLTSVKDFLNLDSDEHHGLAGNIVKRSNELRIRDLVAKAVSKIIIEQDRARIIMDRAKLIGEVCGRLDLPMVQTAAGDTATVILLLEALKPKTGTIVVEPRPKDDVRDPFDRRPQELKDWVRGIIWCDEHFRGMTIRQIAQKENCSVSLVNKMIVASFSAA